MSLLPSVNLPRTGSTSGAWQTLLLIGLCLAACVCGLAIAVLPLSLSVVIAVFFLGLTVVGIAAAAPAMASIPERSLFLGFCFCIGLYFVWPRNVFLPVPALPIKHPQRLAYLLLLAWAFVVWFKCAPARQRVVERMKVIPLVTFAWVVFWVWLGISALGARTPLGAAVAWMLDLLVVAAVFPLALLCLKSGREAKVMCAVLLVAALLNAGFAVVESSRQRNLFEAFSTLHLVDAEMARLVVESKVRGGQYRAQAAFDHPLLFAEFMVCCLPFALALGLGRGRSRWVGLLVTIAIGAGLMLSHSRVALAAALIMGLTLVAVLIVRGAAAGTRNPWPLVITLLVLPIALLIGFFATDVLGNLAQGRSADEANSSNARLTMLSNGLELIAASPVLGYGAGQGAATLNFRNTFGTLTLDNFLLVVALDAGVPALIAFLGMVLGAWWTSVKVAARYDLTTYTWPLAVPAALISFLAIKLVLGTALNNVLLGLLMAMTAIAVQAHRPTSTSHRFT